MFAPTSALDRTMGLGHAETLSVIGSPTHASKKLQRRQRAGERAKHEDEQYSLIFQNLLEMGYQFNLATDSSIQLTEATSNTPKLRSKLIDSVTPLEFQLTVENGLVPSVASVPARRSSLLIGAPTLAINENTNESIYTKLFWKTRLVPKDHQNYIGEISTLGWGCVSIIKESESSQEYIVFIRTVLKFMLVRIPLKETDGRLGVVADDLSSNSPYANFSKLYRALSVYKEQVHAELNQAMQSATDSEKNILCNYIGLIQQFEAVQAAMNLQLVEDPRIIPALKNLEGKIFKQSVNIDVILTHPMGNGLERIQAAESFLDICGEPLVTPAFLAYIEEEASSFAPSSQTIENRKERKEEIIKELLETEKSYLRKLDALVEIRSMLLAGLQRDSDRYYVNSIFYNISAVAETTKVFIEALEQAITDQDPGSAVAVISYHVERSSTVYPSYLHNYNTAVQSLRKFQETNRLYKTQLKRAQDLKSCDRLSIADLLVQPVQRIPRYALIITNLLRYTHIKHADHPLLVQALALVDKIGSLRGYQDKVRLTQLNNIRTTVQGCPEQLLSASRTLLAQLELSEIEPATFTATRAVTLFLFCDTVLLAERVSSGLRFLTWTSVLDLSFTSVEYQSNMTGFYLQYNGSKQDCNGYWNERTVRQYSLHKESDGLKFRSLFYDNLASMKMNVYVNIYDTQDAYEQAIYKSDTKLFYIDALTDATDELQYMQTITPVIGVIQPCRNERFRLLLRSRINTDIASKDAQENFTMLTANNIYHQISSTSRRSYDHHAMRLLFIERVTQGQQLLCNTAYYFHRQMSYNSTWLNSLRSLKLVAQPIVRFANISNLPRHSRRDLVASHGPNRRLQAHYLSRIASSRLIRAVGSVASRDGWSNRNTTIESIDITPSSIDTSYSTSVTSETSATSFASEPVQNKRTTLNICENQHTKVERVKRQETTWAELHRSDSTSSKSTRSSSLRSQNSIERFIRGTWESVRTAVVELRERRVSTYTSEDSFCKKP
ncbi:hypothetical protein BDF19DRAFT_465695 [Syncephalis fuscata]|nr:hypothetical protein BDF19DRAFT_465695 [Syncephalis fuscata]